MQRSVDKHNAINITSTHHSTRSLPGQSFPGLDWIVQCFTSPPTQYRLYGRRFLQVKRPNQQSFPGRHPGYDPSLPRCQQICCGAGVWLSNLYWLMSILVRGTGLPMHSNWSVAALCWLHMLTKLVPETWVRNLYTENLTQVYHCFLHKNNSPANHAARFVSCAGQILE